MGSADTAIVDVVIGARPRDVDGFTVRRALPSLQRRRIGPWMLVGGAPLDGTRHIWWNFVSSSRERVEKAKADWRERRFPSVPGDDVEFVPLPER
jgi:hypothetical protein